MKEELAKNGKSPHTEAMSEIGEMPQGSEPQKMQEPPRKKLEEMDEFKRLAPEQQQKLLALRERMMQDSMSPRLVPARSINEMGFWEGMKETVKPHLKKQKEIMFKDLKAQVSLVLSLIPIIGESKALGAGLFGITKAKDIPWSKVSFEAIKAGKVQFEPFVRVTKAVSRGKDVAKAAKVAKATEQLYTFGKTDGNMFIRGTMKAADAIDYAGAAVKDAVRPATAVLAGIGAGKHSLHADLSKSTTEGVGKVAKTFGVEDIYTVHSKGIGDAAQAYNTTLSEGLQKAGLDHEIAWYKFGDRWKAGSIERAAKRAAKVVRKGAKQEISQIIETQTRGKNFVAGKIETGLKKASPKLVEGVKYNNFKVFFDRWLNLTPDVPHWLSTTTAIGEFLGAHGIDAIPAVMQIAINKYKSAVVSKDMALDVLKYTVNHSLKNTQERKQAAEVFSPAAGTA